jgi:hypothetical protein
MYIILIIIHIIIYTSILYKRYYNIYVYNTGLKLNEVLQTSEMLDYYWNFLIKIPVCQQVRRQFFQFQMFRCT